MAYMCRMGRKTECDGCGYCKAISDAESCCCPICGSEEWDYLCRQFGEIVGCDECVQKIWRDYN